MLLLDRGADPNESNVWDSYLQSFLTRPTDPVLLLPDREESQNSTLQLVGLLLRHQANPNQIVYNSAITGILLDSTPTKDSQNYRFRLIELFFSHGANPNLRYNKSTIWKMFLSNISAWPSPIRFDTMELLLVSGADPYAECYGTSHENKNQKKDLNVAQYINILFTNHEAAKLSVLVKKIQQKHRLGLSSWLG